MLTEPAVARDVLLETLNQVPHDLHYSRTGSYEAVKIGEACLDAAARIEALELELKAAQANQCDGRGSVEFQGILASDGRAVTLCSKCNKWRHAPTCA